MTSVCRMWRQTFLGLTLILGKPFRNREAQRSKAAGSEPKHLSSKCTKGVSTMFALPCSQQQATAWPYPCLSPSQSQQVMAQSHHSHCLDRTETTCRDRPPGLIFTPLEILYCLGGWHRDCGNGSIYNPSDGRLSPPSGQWCIASCPLPTEQAVEKPSTFRTMAGAW